MRIGKITTALAALVGASLVVGCGGSSSGPAPSAPSLEAPAGLSAGVSTRFLDFPVSVPLGGFGGRNEGIFSGPFGSGPQPPEGEARPQPYALTLPPSIGVHTRPRVQVLALSWRPTDGDEQTLVIAHDDAVYTTETLRSRVLELVRERSGVDLGSGLVLTASHTHHAAGPFWEQLFASPAADVFDPEIKERFAASVAGAIVEALERREPARIGMATRGGFDPGDRLYRDRRRVNDSIDLVTNGRIEAATPNGKLARDGLPDGRIKDQRLSVLRVDRASGGALAVLFHFGIHGVALPLENPFLSGDVTLALEHAVEAGLGEPAMVVHMQGATGDVNPMPDGYAAMEQAGLDFAPQVVSLWRDTPTRERIDGIRSSVALVRQDRRTVGYEEPSLGDPYTRFAAPYGAVQCGGLEGLVGVVELPFELPDLTNPFGCLTRPVSFQNPLIAGLAARIIYPVLFDEFVDGETEDVIRDVVLGVNPVGGPYDSPQDLFNTLVGAFVIDGVPLEVDGADRGARDLAFAVLPGEPTTPFSLQLRHDLARVLPGTSFESTWVLGYSNDHQGYLLLKEDWVTGGPIEIGINAWGPLYGDFVLARVVAVAEALARGAPPPSDGYLKPRDEAPLIPEVPTASRLPGVVTGPGNVERFETAAFSFVGGDPVLDTPHVVLEREGEGGGFETVRVRGGRAVDEAGPETMLVYEWDETQADREPHLWSFHWETVVDDAPGVYRFRVEGLNHDGDDAPNPEPPYYEGRPYSFVTAPFELAPATSLEIEPPEVDGASLRLAVRYPPSVPDGDRNTPDAFRARPAAPAASRFEVAVIGADGAVAAELEGGGDGASARVALPATLAPGRYTLSIDVRDGLGNRGSATFGDVDLP